MPTLESLNIIAEALEDHASEMTRLLNNYTQKFMGSSGLFSTPEPLRWRYWKRHSYKWHFNAIGREMFCYSTQRDETNKFGSWVYVCDNVGHVVMKNFKNHAKRKDANARAKRLFDSYKCPCTKHKKGGANGE